MNKSPAFQLYAADFLADENVALMSLAGRGAYITLMCFCWREGSIPSEPERLARLCGVDGSAMQPLMAELLHCFEVAKDNPLRLVHPRLEKERRRQEEHRKERQESGLRGAKLRWNKEIKKDSSAMANPMAKPIANDASSSSSSSSNNKDMTVPVSLEVREIFSYWQTSLNHSQAKLDAKRQRIIQARLKDNFTAADLKLAIDGCRLSPFHQGQNKDGKIFDDLELILRDVKHVEDFMRIKTTGNGLAKPEPERKVVV